MRNSGKHWSKEEDSILISFIKNRNGSMQNAFKKASSEVGRTVDACSFRWYSVLKGNVVRFPDTKNIPKKNVSKNSYEFAHDILLITFNALPMVERKKFIKEQLLKLVKNHD